MYLEIRISKCSCHIDYSGPNVPQAAILETTGEIQHFQHLIPCENSGGGALFILIQYHSIAINLVEKHEHVARIHRFIPFLVVIFASFATIHPFSCLDLYESP